jgi:putative endonuclease
MYILKSENFDEIYTGFTKDLKARLIGHNSGKSPHTKKFKPWKLIVYIAFEPEILKNISRQIQE